MQMKPLQISTHSGVVSNPRSKLGTELIFQIPPVLSQLDPFFLDLFFSRPQLTSLHPTRLLEVDACGTQLRQSQQQHLQSLARCPLHEGEEVGNQPH